MSKADAAACQGVYGRRMRARNGLWVTTHRLVGLVIAEDEENVGWPGRLQAAAPENRCRQEEA